MSIEQEDATTARYVEIVTDFIRPHHRYSKDVDLEAVLSVDLESLDPDTLKALADAVAMSMAAAVVKV